MKRALTWLGIFPGEQFAVYGENELMRRYNQIQNATI